MDRDNIGWDNKAEVKRKKVHKPEHNKSQVKEQVPIQKSFLQRQGLRLKSQAGTEKETA